MDCSMSGFPIHHQFLELAQTHVHWVGDAIQPSHLLSSPSPPSFNLSQHQGLFQWVSSLHGGQSIGALASASVLPMNIQDWFPLGWTGWISLQSKGFSRVFSNTTVQKQRHYFANKGPSSQGYGFSSSHVWMWELDCNESWAPKNWCFWTVVLEKTLESLGLQANPTSQR